MPAPSTPTPARAEETFTPQSASKLAHARMMTTTFTTRDNHCSESVDVPGKMNEIIGDTM